MKRYKVLIIAGGGIFGCIPARFLSMVTQPQSLHGIDVLSGCSIGGILALAYASGKTFSAVDDCFQLHAADCFRKRLAAKLNPLASPVYKTEELDKVIATMIDDITLEETRDVYPDLDIFIPTLDITADNYKVFDNLDKQDSEMPIRLLAGMTSAAPTYFEGREYRGHCYVDGGLIEVDPILTAVTGLKYKRGIPFEQMDVLVLGTGQDIDEHPIHTEEYNQYGKLQICSNVIVPYTTLGNKLAARFWGEQLGFHYFSYFNPCFTNGALDDVSQIPSLIALCDCHKEDFIRQWEEWKHS